MIPNNNLSVLPWYNDMAFQNHKKSYAYGNIYPLFVPKNKLIPFQIIRGTRPNQIVGIQLNDRYGNPLKDMLQIMLEAGLQIVRFETLGYDVIVFPADFQLNMSDVQEGIYFLSIYDGAEMFYSELFTFVNNVDGYLKIEWYDVDNFVFEDGQIVYKNPNFKNRLYLCAEIGKPEYIFEEDGETRDGYFFPEKQISEKTYKFTHLAPEYLCDVMRIIRMSDYIYITAKGQQYKCDTFLMTPKWQTQGDIASVEVEFQTATVMKKIGRGFIEPNSGDFNNDFNNDFDNN